MTFGKLENKYTYKCGSHLKSKIPAGVLLHQTFEGRLLILIHLEKKYGQKKSIIFKITIPKYLPTFFPIASFVLNVLAKSLEISPAVGDFYGTDIEILAVYTGPKFGQGREHLHCTAK